LEETPSGAARLPAPSGGHLGRGGGGDVEMEAEEEAEAPVMNVEEERKKRAKAMKSTKETLAGLVLITRQPDPSRQGVAAVMGDATMSRQRWWTRPYHGLGRRRDKVAVHRTGEMRARVSWTVVLAVFLAFPPFQRERVEEMGFREIFRMNRMRADSALTQALQSRWDAEATAFVFPWGHMIPSLEDVSRITWLRVHGISVSGYTYPFYHDLAQRLLELPVERRSSLVLRVPLQESLGLFDVRKGAGESEDEHLDKLVQVSRRELESDPGAQADLDLRRFLVLFLGRLLFAMRGDTVHCRFLPLLEDLSEVGGYAWGAAFLAHQFDSLGASERQTSTSGFFPFLQVWAYLHLSALGRGDLTRPGLVPIARRWDSCRDSRNLGDQLERLQEAIDGYPYLDAVWQPYLGEGDEGQPWLVQARPYFGRSSAVEFPVRDRFRRLGRSFRGLHDTTDWREREKEQIDNWEHRGKAVDVAGEVATLRALLYSAVQDREAAQRQTAELRRELERVRSTGAGGASSSRAAGGSSSLLEAQLARAVLRAKEAQRHLEELERDLRLTTEHAMDL
ncbi:hypothetical protein Taro_055580, partial [Colocasia esculenta]|nr:hypothetical protein [Colocasia esculenta]